MKPTPATETQLAELSTDLRQRLRAAIEACPYRVTIRSAWRSRAEQQRLYDGYKAGRPGFNPANPPGMSKHEDTTRDGKPAANAADLAYTDEAGRVWFHRHAREFGLGFPIRRENWHVESNGTLFRPPAPPAPQEDIVATKAELVEVVRKEVDRLAGGPRRSDRKDTDPQTISVADVLTAVEQLGKAQADTNARLARIETALGSGS